MINRTSQNWPEGTAIEITGEEMEPTTTTEDLLEALKALLDIIHTRQRNQMHAFTPLLEMPLHAQKKKSTHASGLSGAIELIANATAKAIIANIERKPMSDWTKEEMKIYLTGQFDSEFANSQARNANNKKGKK
jgi:hypothetical protein